MKKAINKNGKQAAKDPNSVFPVSAEDVSRMLSRTIVDLLIREPFYAHVLQGMTRSITTEVETAAVTYRNEQLMLLINPNFFCSLTTDRQRTGLLKHEILHIALNHLFRPENKEGESRLFLNLAADLVVNQLIPAADLPPGAILLKSFPKLKLEPNKNTAYYLERLKAYVRQYAGADGKLKVLFDACHSDHSGWKEGRSAEAVAARLAAADLIERAVTSARQRGHVPAELLAQLSLEKEVPALVPWKQVMRRFVQRTGLTSIRYTNKRISRRFGTRPGLKIQQQLRLLVAIDTSGSVSDKDLEEFFIEINGMSRLLSELWIVECDAKIHRCYRYRSDTRITVTGRGGTDLDPVFEFSNTRRPMFDAVIYLTDGEAAQPKVISIKPILLVINNKRHSLKPAKNLSIIEFQSKNS